MLRRLLCAGLLLLIAACGTTYVPGVTSITDVDAPAVNNGQKSLVVMRVSTPWGSPAETRWLHLESGELIKITAQFGAGTQQKAREFDMVTLPAGHYMLAYVMYSDGSKGAWPSAPFDLDPSLSEVTRLGQVHISESGGEGEAKTTVSALRSKALANDGKSPIIAGFTVTPGKVLYLGTMTVSFDIKGRRQLPGYYPAGSVAWSVDMGSFERARMALAKEDPGLAEQLGKGKLSRGSLAKNL